MSESAVISPNSVENDNNNDAATSTIPFHGQSEMMNLVHENDQGEAFISIRDADAIPEEELFVRERYTLGHSWLIDINLRIHPPTLYTLRM